MYCRRGNRSKPASGKPAPEVTVGERTLYASFADNFSAALTELLKAGAVTVEMSDYGGFEKVGEPGADLPGNGEDITTGPDVLQPL